MTEDSSIPPERALGRVEGKLDLLLSRFDKFDDRHAAIELRVTGLERRFMVLTIAGAASIAAYVGDIKTSLLTIIKAVF
jgi:hypothetical protein